MAKARTATARPAALLEREAELALLSAALARARDERGSVVVVEAWAGLGKTALLAAARARAGAAGVQCLAASGRELERGFPFGVICQLLEPALAAIEGPARRELLAGAGRHAEQLLGDHADLEAGPDAGFATVHALYWLVAGLAEHAPLLLTVDDAHLADAESLRALAYLAPRLDELPVLLLAAAREGEPAAADVPELLEPSGVLRPGPLGAAGTAALVRGLLAEASDGFCAACHRATGGNPFLVRELVLTSAREGIGADDPGGARLAGLAPETVARATFARIQQHGPHARSLATAVAVLESGGLREAAELAGLDEETAVTAADRLAAAAIFAPGLPLRFAHPVLRTAVHDDMAPVGRDGAHRRAASLLVRSPGATEAAAAHLLESEPRGDDWAAAALREAAGRALARGAPDAAARLARRALAEGAPIPDRPELLLQLGRAELLSGDPAALEHLRAGLESSHDPLLRARALGQISVAAYLAGDLDGTLRAAGAGLEELAGRDGGFLAVELLQAFAMAGRPHPEHASEVRARIAAPPADERSVAASARAGLRSFDLVLAGGDREEACGLARRALSDARLLSDELAGALVREAAIYALACAGEPDEADAAVRAAEAAARGSGSVMRQALVSQDRLFCRWRRGLVRQGLTDADDVLEMAGRGWTVQTAPARIAACDLLLERGDLAGAAAVVDLPDSLAAQLAGTWADPWLDFVRARLALAAGDAARALDAASRCGDKLAAAAAPNPAYCAWRSLAVEAALGAGKRAHARELSEEQLELARAFGSPASLGASLRTAATVEDGSRALALLEESERVLRPSVHPLERAHTLVELGALLRRARRAADARPPLGEALGLAHQCGATALAARARDELLAAGGRPRRVARRGIEALTPREFRVAELAAAGLGNREIAQTLFITRKTVEAHLRSVFRKLGVSSRSELPDDFRRP